jgi:formyl-CoA transferase
MPQQAGNNHPTSIPTGVFKTADSFINIATTGGAIWARYAGDRGANLLNDPDYATIALRSKNRDALNAAIGTYMAKRSTAEWIDILNTAGVPCGPINSIDQVFDDAQVKHLGIAQPLPDGGKQLVGQPFTLSHAAPHGCARRSSASRPMTSDGIRIHRTGNRLAPAEQGRQISRT